MLWRAAWSVFPTASQPAGTSVPLILPSDLQQSNPSFFSINIIRQFSIAAPSNSHSSSPKKWRKMEGKKKKGRGCDGEHIQKAGKGAAGFWQEVPWCGCFVISSYHLVAPGSMPADFSSITSHFRFIWTCFSSLLSFRWLASIEAHHNSSEALPHRMVRSVRNLARGA